MYELEIKPSNIWQQEMFYAELKTHPLYRDHAKVNERLQAGQQLRHWSNNGRISYGKDYELPEHLARLLGHPSYTHLMHNHNERDSEVLQALVGPHGFAIYKALEARSYVVAMEASSKDHG